MTNFNYAKKGDQPKLAVVIPTYNRREMLGRLLATIPHDVACCISDNGSFLEKDAFHGRPMLQVKQTQSVLPMFENWRAAADMLDGGDETYFSITSDDDIYKQDAFELVRKTISLNKEIDIFIFGNDHINEINSAWDGYVPAQEVKYEPPFGFKEFSYGVSARMPSVFFRKSFYEKIGGIDTSYKLTASDSELVQRALLLGRSMFVPEIVASYRVWSGSLTHSRQAADEWIGEVNAWVTKIADLAKKTYAVAGMKFDEREFRGEIIGLNLLSGIYGLMSRGQYADALAFYARHEIPVHASWKTRLRLWVYRLRLMYRAR